MGKLKLSTDEGRVLQLPVSAFEKIDGRWIIKKENVNGGSAN